MNECFSFLFTEDSHVCFNSLHSCKYYMFLNPFLKELEFRNVHSGFISIPSMSALMTQIPAFPNTFP